MRIVVHCKDLGPDDLTYLRNLKFPNVRIKVTTDGGLTTLVATGIYDDLVKVIIAVTVVKNFEIHIQ